MRIRKIKFISGNYYFTAVLVVILIIVLIMCVDSKLKEQEEPLLAYLIDSGEINLEMAELLHIKCMREFLYVKKTLQDLEHRSTNDRSSSRTKMHEALTISCPHVKKTLIDCLWQKPNRSYSWYTRCLRSWSLFPRHLSSTRRELAHASQEEHASSPVIPIIVVTAALAISGLFFFYCRNSSAGGRNNESPLLSLCSSDQSVASTQKLNNIGATAAKERYSNRLSVTTNKSSMNLHTETQSPRNSTIEILPEDTCEPFPPPPGIPTLKLPPGRTSSELPPLKLPPGRASSCLSPVKPVKTPPGRTTSTLPAVKLPPRRTTSKLPEVKPPPGRTSSNLPPMAAQAMAAAQAMMAHALAAVQVVVSHHPAHPPSPSKAPAPPPLAPPPPPPKAPV
ncbi:hypothetical protein CASFOL_019111 [Castilleja foliolosa]|uniref:Uncharacterized protein n=1 Tax=Castilleja foliolosa TaxID=1961234 RepID=A0ABD3D7T6_9LAMI